MLTKLIYAVTLCLPVLFLPQSAVANKYEADVTKRYPKVEYGPQTTMYREQCESWVLRLMWERNRKNRNRDRVMWEKSWNEYAGNLLWCQQFPTYNEMNPPTQYRLPDIASR